jgi:hypothetical protein
MTMLSDDLGPVPADVLSRTIEHGGYWRGSPLRLGDAPGHKEWLHFCIYGDGVDLLVNFSIVDDLAAHTGAPREFARITCLVHTRAGWNGDVLGFPPEQVAARRGYISLEFGSNSVQFHDGVFYIKAALPERGIALELTLTPAAVPSPANNIAVEDGPPIHWIVVPRLFANGVVLVGNVIHRLRDAPAYHDHNWGHFRWGRNFAWEWGHGVPCTRAEVWSSVFVRLSDRGHSQTLMQALFVWRGARQHRIFRDEELTVTHEGLLRPRVPFKLPRVMGLLHPGSAADIPARLRLDAAGRGDFARIEFTFDDVAQVIIPNDDDLGVTVINEVNGRYLFDGNIRGEVIETSGRAVVEFLSH